MSNNTLQFELNSLPQSLRNEVGNFIEFLKSKSHQEIKSKPKKRKFGYAKGKIKLSADFDAPLEEFSSYSI